MRALLGALLSLAAFAASAQDWPTRPVTMIVPYAPGGNIDQAARLFARELGVDLARVDGSERGGRITRVHGPFVADEEVHRIVEYLKQL